MIKTLEEGLQQAQAAQQQADWAAALVAYRQMLVQFQPTATFWTGLGQAFIGLKRWREALAAFEAALRLEPQRQDARLGLADTTLRLGNLEQAAQGYTQLLHRPEAHLGLAEIGLVRGDYALVELEAQEVLRVRASSESQGESEKDKQSSVEPAGAAIQRAQLLLLQSRLLLGDLAGAMTVLSTISLPNELKQTDPDHWLVYLWRLRTQVSVDVAPLLEADFWKQLAQLPLARYPDTLPSGLIFMPPEMTAPPLYWATWRCVRAWWLQQLVDRTSLCPPQAWPLRTAGVRPRIALYVDPRVPLLRYLVSHWLEAMLPQEVECVLLVPEAAMESVRSAAPINVLPINAEWSAAQLARLIAERDFDLLIDWMGAADARFATVLALQVSRNWVSQSWSNTIAALQPSDISDLPGSSLGGAASAALQITTLSVPFPWQFFRPTAERNEPSNEFLRVGFAANWLSLGDSTSAMVQQLVQRVPQVHWVVVADATSEVEWLRTRLIGLGVSADRLQVAVLRDFSSTAWAGLDVWLSFLSGDLMRPSLAWGHQVPVLHLTSAEGEDVGYVDILQLWLAQQGRAEWVWSKPDAWLEGVVSFLSNPPGVRAARQQLVDGLAKVQAKTDTAETLEIKAWQQYARNVATALQKIVAEQPSSPATYEHLSARLRDAVLAQQKQQRPEAENICRELLALQPAAPMLNYLLAELLTQRAEYAEAIPLLQQVVSTAPLHKNAWLALADALTTFGRGEEVTGYLKQALTVMPEQAALWRALARAEIRQGDQRHLLQAETTLHQALELDAGQADVFFLQGLLAQRRGQSALAFEVYQKALAFDPRHREGQFNLGVLAWESGNNDLAIAAFDGLLQQDPGFTMAYPYRGEALYAVGRYQDWLSNGDRYRQFAPNALRQIGYALETAQFRGDFDQIDRLLHTLRENRGHADSDAELVEALDTLLYLLHFFDLEEEVFARLYQTFDQAASSVYGAPLTLVARPPVDQQRRLRIGYLSGDWRDHVMGKMMREILRRHDRNRFEVYIYATDAREDAMTQEIKGYADHWVTLAGQDERLAAEAIAQDGLDVLIDCSGHTQGGRPGILALKPAPVIGSQVAAAGAVGLSTIDFKVTDRYADLPVAQETMIERLMVLEGCCYPYRAMPPLTADDDVYPYTREQLGLTGRIVIGAFITHLKLSRRCLMLWKRVLEALPEAVLAFSPNREGLRPAYLNLLKAAGIAAERAVFLPRSGSEVADQARYRLVDLVLDPMPYSGVNGTMEALNARVPVVTLVGKRHSERSSYSILMNLGVEETIAQQATDYVAIAVRLARDAGFKTEVVAKIEAGLHSSVLVDMDAYVHRWEGALWAAVKQIE